MKVLLSAFLAILTLTSAFIAANNIPQLPWEITRYLWYAYLPSLAASIGFAYGITAKRSGGSILLAAAVIIPIAVLSAKYTLPFASTFQNIPSLIAAALLPLTTEIIARSKKQKKQIPKEPAV